MTALAKADTSLAEEDPLPPMEETGPEKEPTPLPRDDRVWRYALEPRPTATRDHIDRLDRGYKTPRYRAAPMAPRVQPRRKPPLFRTRDIILAVALTLFAGAATSAVVYDRLEDGALINRLKSMMPQAAAEAPPKITVIAPTTKQAAAAPSRKKPIVTARVDAGNVAGTTNSMIPLHLKISSTVPQEALAFRLSGLPENAYLTAGIRMGKDQWLLKPQEAENARLVIPKAPAAQFAINVAAIEAETGELISPYVSMKVAMTESVLAASPVPATAAIIMPAAAPHGQVGNFNKAGQQLPQDLVMITKENTAQPLPVPVEARNPDDTQARKLMADGDSLMESGDLAAARAFYAQAMSLGVKEAAFAMGQTYDPSVFADKKVLGLKPDTAQALRYYQLAAAAGVPQARDAMSALQARLEQ